MTIRNLSKTFTSRGQAVHALAGVNLDIERGETLGLVGRVRQREDDARADTARAHPARCRVGHRDGRRAARRLTSGERSQAQLKALQIVFQNPDSALNRRHTVRRLISRPLVKLAGLVRVGAHRTAD